MCTELASHQKHNRQIGVSEKFLVNQEGVDLEPIIISNHLSQGGVGSS